MNLNIWSSTQVVTGKACERVLWTKKEGFVGAAVKILRRPKANEILGTARGQAAMPRDIGSNPASATKNKSITFGRHFVNKCSLKALFT